MNKCALCGKTDEEIMYLGAVLREHPSLNALIGKGVRERDKELFFGPIREGDTFMRFSYEARLPVVLREMGIVQSGMEAVRNGWDCEIPDGFSDHFFGKRKKRLSILKIK